jgi:hypothetical protein
MIKNLKQKIMNKKMITGAMIVLAAGIAAFIYNRRRNRLNEAAADSYNELSDALKKTENETEHIFS